MPVKEFHQAWVRFRSLSTGEWLVHPDLRTRLIEDAERHGTNLTDVALAILSDRYKIPHQQSSRRTVPRADGDFLNMRVPVRLWKAIRAAANRSGRKDMDELRFALCSHYGLRVPPAPTRKRTIRSAS